jgi:RHS repeat-associated protein
MKDGPKINSFNNQIPKPHFSPILRQYFISVVVVIMLAMVLQSGEVPALHAQEMIDPRSGRLILNEADLALQSGSIALFFQRAFQNKESESGLLGTRWRLNWEKRLIHTGPILIIKEIPAPTAFTQEEGKEEYKSPSGEMITFQKDGQAIRTRSDWTKERYDPNGRLIESEFLNGNKVKLIYSADGKLGRMEGPKGVFLKFTSDDKGRVTLIETSTGTRVRYTYAKDNLAEVQINNSVPTKYTYNENGALTKLERPLTGSVDFTYDAKARVTKRKWADGSEERYEYDNANNTFRQINPSGGITTSRRSKDGLREEVMDPLGNKSAIEYNRLGLLVSITGPTGITSQFAYDDLGRTTAVEGYFGEIIRFEYLGNSPLVKGINYSDGSQQVYEYDDNHNLLSIKEGDEVISAYTYYPDGLIASVKGLDILERKFSYHPDGRLKSETNALGQTTIYEHDKRGNLVREIDPTGRTTLYKYDDQDRLLSVIDPAGATTRYTYDIKGRLVQITNATNGITRFEYDAIGRVASKTDAAGRNTRYQYNPDGLVSSVIYPGGGTYKYIYDAIGNLTNTINPLGGETRFTYDSLGHLLSVTDPTGRIWRNEYSLTGQIKKIISPTGEAIDYQYNAKGQREGVTTPTGLTLRFERDSKSRVATLSVHGGVTIKYNYDKAGKLVSKSDNLGKANRYEFNPQGRLIREINSQGIETTYQYDASGDLIGVKDNLGASLTMQFNPQGILSSLTNSTKSITRYQYDLSGRLIELTNPLGHIKRISYTPIGEIAQVTEPTGDRARYEYDEAGHLGKIRHPGGGITEFTYDAMGNLLSKKNPIGAISSFTYDKAGQLICMTDAKGQTATFIYDPAGRLSKKQRSDGKIINYKYDAAGKLIEVDDGTFPIQYIYDSAGQLIQINYPVIKRNLKYEYDSVGLLSKRINSEGQEIHYEYDTHKHLRVMRLPDGKTIKFTYDAKNRLTSMVYPNGVKGTWEYDVGGRAIRIAYINDLGKVLSEWRYTYDANSNTFKSVNEKGQTFQYQYDPNEQLIEEASPSGTIRYSYLPGGNRKQIESKGKIKQYQYNQADQLVKAEEEAFKYDANGNMVERSGPGGITKYIYDAENQLIKVMLPDNAEITFGYAPTGERIWRRDKKGMTWFIHEGLNLSGEFDESLNLKTSYYHAPGIDRPVVMLKNDGAYFYHTNAIGSITTLTHSDGKILTVYETDAFGNLKSPSGDLSNPFIFTGREYEQDIGLYYYRTRYYDPALGRFLSEDPIIADLFVPLSLNPYIYVLNNPLTFRDPLGAQSVGGGSREEIQAHINRVLAERGLAGYANVKYNPNLKGPGYTDPVTKQVYLGPSGIKSDQVIARTAVHEFRHVEQISRAANAPIGAGAGTQYPAAGTPAYRVNEIEALSTEFRHSLRNWDFSGMDETAGGILTEGVMLLRHPTQMPGAIRSLVRGFVSPLPIPRPPTSGPPATSGPGPESGPGPGSGPPPESGPGPGSGPGPRSGPAPESGPGPGSGLRRISGAAGKIAMGAGIVAAGIDIAAGMAEGDTLSEAAKATGRTIAEGTISLIKYGAPAAGVIAGGAYLIGGGAAVAGVVTVGLPVLTIGAAVVTVASIPYGIDRLLNAEAVKNERTFQETQYRWLEKLDGVVANLEGRITSALAGTRQEATNACTAIQGYVGTANNHKNSAQTLKKSLADLTAQIKETSALCKQAQTMKARIDAIQSKIKGYEGVAESAYGWAQGNPCSTTDDGAKLRKLSGELEGLSKGVLGLVAEANAKNDDLKTIKARSEVAKGALGTAEAISAQIAGEAAGAASAREKGLQQISQAEKLKSTLQEKSDLMQGQLQEQVMALRSLMPPELLPANENKFTNLMGFVNRFRDSGCDTNALKMELEQAMLESRLDNQASQGLIGSVRGTLSGCDKIAFADGATSDIQGSVDHMLILVAGVKIKADDCTVKTSQDIIRRYGDQRQARDQQVRDRQAADASRGSGTQQPPVIPTSEGPQGPGGTTTTPDGGKGPTTSSGGGTTSTGGVAPPISGGTGTSVPTKGGTQTPTKSGGTTTAGTSQGSGQTSQPSTVSIRADSGHIIQINFPNGEGKSVKQGTLQSGKYTQKMNTIMCPDVKGYVDAAVNISVAIGSGEAYYIYTIRDVWDDSFRNLVVKRGVNRIGKPVNEGDLKRITSDFNVFVDIFSKGESVGRTYFCVRGAK